MAIHFSKEKVINRIKFENPWWENGKIDTYYGQMKRRAYFKLFFPLLKERSIKRALVMMGPRRVGKTVLLHHAINELLKEEVKAKNICYFSIETPLYNGIGLEELLHLYFEINNKSSSIAIEEEIYIFFDEIQYLKDWEVHLKSLVDSYHHIKFIVSGSAAAALKLKSRESGAGRFTEFVLPPLTFHEYLLLTENEPSIVIEPQADRAVHVEYKKEDIEQLNQYFLDYINFGGYPEVSLSTSIQSDPGRYIRSDIIDKVLMRDLPVLYGISDIQELNSLFTYIAYNSGSEMSLEEISQNAGVAKNTIRKYINYLEAAFLIRIIHRIDQNGKKFKRANFFKVYLTNPSLRSALFTPIEKSDQYMGNMVETAIFSQWQQMNTPNLYYARWKAGEVDVVGLNNKQKPDWCIEVKYSNRFVSQITELKNLRSFCKKHGLNSVLVTTIDIYKKVVANDLIHYFVPASLYCYFIGKNAIEERKRYIEAYVAFSNFID